MGLNEKTTDNPIEELLKEIGNGTNEIAWTINSDENQEPSCVEKTHTAQDYLSRDNMRVRLFPHKLVVYGTTRTQITNYVNKHQNVHVWLCVFVTEEGTTKYNVVIFCRRTTNDPGAIFSYTGYRTKFEKDVLGEYYKDFFNLDSVTSLTFVRSLPRSKIPGEVVIFRNHAVSGFNQGHALGVLFAWAIKKSECLSTVSESTSEIIRRCENDDVVAEVMKWMKKENSDEDDHDDNLQATSESNSNDDDLTDNTTGKGNRGATEGGKNDGDGGATGDVSSQIDELKSNNTAESNATTNNPHESLSDPGNPTDAPKPNDTASEGNRGRKDDGVSGGATGDGKGSTDDLGPGILDKAKKNAFDKMKHKFGRYLPQDWDVLLYHLGRLMLAYYVYLENTNHAIEHVYTSSDDDERSKPDCEPDLEAGQLIKHGNNRFVILEICGEGEVGGGEMWTFPPFTGDLIEGTALYIEATYSKSESKFISEKSFRWTMDEGKLKNSVLPTEFFCRKRAGQYFVQEVDKFIRDASMENKAKEKDALHSLCHRESRKRRKRLDYQFLGDLILECYIGGTLLTRFIQSEEVDSTPSAGIYYHGSKGTTLQDAKPTDKKLFSFSCHLCDKDVDITGPNIAVRIPALNQVLRDGSTLIRKEKARKDRSISHAGLLTHFLQDHFFDCAAKNTMEFMGIESAFYHPSVRNTFEMCFKMYTDDWPCSYSQPWSTTRLNEFVAGNNAKKKGKQIDDRLQKEIHDNIIGRPTELSGPATMYVKCYHRWMWAKTSEYSVEFACLFLIHRMMFGKMVEEEEKNEGIVAEKDERLKSIAIKLIEKCQNKIQYMTSEYELWARPLRDQKFFQDNKPRKKENNEALKANIKTMKDVLANMLKTINNAQGWNLNDLASCLSGGLIKVLDLKDLELVELIGNHAESPLTVFKSQKAFARSVAVFAFASEFLSRVYHVAKVTSGGEVEYVKDIVQEMAP